MSRPLALLSDEQQRMLKNSPVTPRVAIRIQAKADKAAQAVSAEFIVADGDSKAFVNEIEVSLEKFRTLEGFLQTYFPKVDCHKHFPTAKALKAATPALAEQLQRYVDELLKIPGICIFQPFVDTFSVDLSRLVQPGPKP
jgi:hypothetical protein